MLKDLPSLIQSSAKRYQLNPQLIAAIVWQESEGEPSVVRLEQGFFHKYILPMIHVGRFNGYTPPSDKLRFIEEALLRACSFGLMQIMLQTARERGFRGDHPGDTDTGLLNPAVNLDVGCAYFAALMKATGNDEKKSLLRWNGGGNVKYPDEVFSHRGPGGPADRLLGGGEADK